MLEFSKRTNTLEQTEYKYSLQDVRRAASLSLCSTTMMRCPRFRSTIGTCPCTRPTRSGSPTRPFATASRRARPTPSSRSSQLFKLMHDLGGPKGIIRQSEFFLYSERDRDALDACRELGYEFPEITSWIRATRQGFPARQGDGHPRDRHPGQLARTITSSTSCT